MSSISGSIPGDTATMSAKAESKMPATSWKNAFAGIALGASGLIFSQPEAWSMCCMQTLTKAYLVDANQRPWHTIKSMRPANFGESPFAVFWWCSTRLSHIPNVALGTLWP